MGKGGGMKINHINLTVTDVLAAAEFLEKYFGVTNQGGNKGFTVEVMA